MTGGMMGRTSDTRIYNPRSESSEMFRDNHEDERPPKGIEDGLDKEKRQDKKQAKKEQEEKEDNSIRHIKVKNHHLGLKGKQTTEMEDEDEGGKKEADLEPSNQTMPAGAGGFLTSLATQAKGPGAAGGEMIQMSKPMEGAWSELLKNNPSFPYPYPPTAPKDDEEPCPDCKGSGIDPDDFMECGSCEGEGTKEAMDRLYPPKSDTIDFDDNPETSDDNPWEKVEEKIRRERGIPPGEAIERNYEKDWQEKNKSEPMDMAWGMLKKNQPSKSLARQRKKEGYAKWRPSTGQFELPKGGSSPHTATSRRAKNISRNLPLGRKTGLMKPHLSVEFSHRGLASKQPMSKDPQKYRAYLASQHARKLLGNVRSTVSPHLSHSQRSFYAGPTGGGHLSGTLQTPRVPRPRLHQVRAPSIVPPKMKMPRLQRPKMPSMVTMSEDEIVQSDILKENFYDTALMRHMIKEIRDLMHQKKDRDSKKKGKGQPDVSGAASNLPNYAGNNPVSTTNPEGGTEDEDDARRWGMSPHDLVGRGSGRA
tara:strand:- start:15059 stop:16660 length:1602 start_codon:yes stop_codon:yes gene_type:complete